MSSAEHMLVLLQVLASNVMALVSCPLRSHPLVAASIPKPELACSYLRNTCARSGSTGRLALPGHALPLLLSQLWAHRTFLSTASDCRRGTSTCHLWLTSRWLQHRYESTGTSRLGIPDQQCPPERPLTVAHSLREVYGCTVEGLLGVPPHTGASFSIPAWGIQKVPGRNRPVQCLLVALCSAVWLNPYVAAC